MASRVPAHCPSNKKGQTINSGILRYTQLIVHSCVLPVKYLLRMFCVQIRRCRALSSALGSGTAPVPALCSELLPGGACESALQSGQGERGERHTQRPGSEGHAPFTLGPLSTWSNRYAMPTLYPEDSPLHLPVH